MRFLLLALFAGLPLASAIAEDLTSLSLDTQRGVLLAFGKLATSYDFESEPAASERLPAKGSLPGYFVKYMPRVMDEGSIGKMRREGLVLDRFHWEVRYLPPMGAWGETSRYVDVLSRAYG